MIKHILSIFLLMNLFYIVSAQKSDVKDHIINGNQLYKHKDYSKAELKYRQALSKDPNSIKGNYNLGNSLYQQGKFDEARAHYEKVIKNPNASKEEKEKANYNMGRSYLDQRKFDEAEHYFKESLKLNPDDENARNNYNLAKKEIHPEDLEKTGNSEEKKDPSTENSDSEKPTENKEKQDEGDKGEQNEKQKPQNQNGKQEGGENGDKDGEAETPQNTQITKGEDGKGKNSSQPLNSERQEGLLEALRQQEQETLKKIISQKAKKVRVNTEKDW